MVAWIEDGARKEPRTYYDFVPGPMYLAIRIAALNPRAATAVVIEEINRGNCAAIFGDVFQLLDRTRADPEKARPPYWSQFPIDVTGTQAAWLIREVHEQVRDSEVVRPQSTEKGKEHVKLSLPPNLYLIATANTADQSLYPIDAAFRRRWAVKYKGLESGAQPPPFDVPVVGGKKPTMMPWQDFRRRINRRIVEHTGNDDRQLAGWFVRPDVGSRVLDDEVFLARVVLYLWSDVLRDMRSTVFRKDLGSFDDVMMAYGRSEPIFAEGCLDDRSSDS